MFIIDDFFNAIFGAIVQDFASTNDYNLQMQGQQYQNEWNAEQAQIAREWDAPVNQMQRFKDAGINPAMAANAITGQSTHSSPVANSGGNPYSPVTGNPLSNIANIAKAFSDVEKNNADIENINKQTGWIDRLNDAKIKEIGQSIKESISKENLNEEQKNYYNTCASEMIRMNDQQLVNLRKDVDQKNAAILLIGEQIKNTSKATEVLSKDIEVKDTEIASMQSNIAKNESDIAKNESDIQRNEKLNQVSNADIAEKLSLAGLNQAATILKNAEFNLTSAEARKTLAEAIITELKSDLAEKGMFVDSSFLNNFVTVPSNTNNWDDAFKPITDFLEFISKTGQSIETAISDMNAKYKAKKEIDLPKTIYSRAGRTNWNPNVTSDSDYPYNR